MARPIRIVAVRRRSVFRAFIPSIAAVVALGVGPIGAGTGGTGAHSLISPRPSVVPTSGVSRPTSNAGLAWTNLSTSSVPTGLNCSQMVYDPDFGGEECFGTSPENPVPTVWTLDAGVWKNVTPGPSPWACHGTPVFDVADDYAVLFCGSTWTFAAGSWTNRSPPAPNASDEPTAEGGYYGTNLEEGYDASSGQIVLVEGSFPYRGPAPANATTWTYSRGQWTNVSASAGPLPNMIGGLLISDPRSGGVVYEGGAARDGEPGTWLYAHGRWANETLPLGRLPVLSAAVFDPNLGQLVGVSPNGSTWESSNGSAWSEVPTVVRPYPRNVAPPANATTLLFDPTSNRTLLLSDGAIEGPCYCTPTCVCPGLTSAPDVVWGLGDASIDVLPEIAQLGAEPGVVDLWAPLAVTASTSGGVGPLRYAWSGLPLPCVSANTSIVRCAPEQTGIFLVRLVVTDAIGDVAFAAVNVSVVAVPPTAGYFATEGALVILAGAGSFALGVVMVREVQRRRRNAAAKGPPGPDGATRDPGSGREGSGTEPPPRRPDPR